MIAVFAVVNADHLAAAKGLRRGLARNALMRTPDWGARLDWNAVFGSVSRRTRSDSRGAADLGPVPGRKQEDLKGVAVYGDPGLAEAVRRSAGHRLQQPHFAFDPRTGLPVKGLLVMPLDANGNGVVDPAEDLSTREKALNAIRLGLPGSAARSLHQRCASPSARPAGFHHLDPERGPEVGLGSRHIPISKLQRQGALAAAGL